MSGLEDTNGASGERGKEHMISLMHPQASVVAGRRHFFPYGCTPPEYLLGGIPNDARRADMLLLGCSDARHALFTLWTYGSECNRERGRWDRLEPEERRQQQQRQQQQQQQGSSASAAAAPADDSLRTLRFTLNDREPACLARVLLLLQLFLNSYEELVGACSPDATPESREAYSARIALCFNAYYNIYVDNATLHALQAAANQLLEASASPASWTRSPVGSIAHVAGRQTLDRLRCMWYMYADTSIVQMKPKKHLDKERKTYHDDTVSSNNKSRILLTGEGPGIAAPKAMEWGAELTGVHRQYQFWGYLDPFPVLRDGARSDRKYYTKANPAMVGTDHHELEYQVHHNCNPLSAFHHDNVWVSFEGEDEENTMKDDTHDGGGGDAASRSSTTRPLYCGPPRVSGVDLAVGKRPAEFEDEPEEAKQHIMSKLVATGLEQLSRMCWAANWALAEKEQAQASAALARQGRPRGPVDVRLNFVLGDAVDTCDALCLLSSEGLSAWGKARDGDEPARVCSFMPNMSLAPCHLELRDVDGPARFDFIDSSYLADTLGVLNVVMAASPLLKPSPHAVLRTDLRRSGPARKRLSRAKDVAAAIAAQADAEKSVEGLDAKGKKKKMKKKEAKLAAAAFGALTDEDWCTTQVHECAMLLGVVPVSSIVPAVGHFHTMLEAARVAKTNKKNLEIGDLGQRLRLAWKQACLIDQRSCAFVGSQERSAMTLHPRVYLKPAYFSAMVLPFWLFMTRNLYVETGDCPKVLEGGQQQLRVSPYTPASFARLLSHALRFLKLDTSHTLQVVDDLNRHYSEGLFGADVVAQLEAHMHLLSLHTTEALGATDVVRWARDCPWWERKPADEGVVPPGAPGMCRVVMIASEEAVAIIRQLRDPTLCVLMHDESKGSSKGAVAKTLMSTLHCCFVRVHRSSGPFPPEDREGAPWFVLRDRLLRVREARPDDPEAELMVSFLVSSKTLLPSKAEDIELELRLQDSATKDAAPAAVAKALEAAEGVIFRTRLNERGETAVVFPNKRPSATTLERWLPQSGKWHGLLHDDKGVEPGLGQRRVGKMNRYIISPGRPELMTLSGGSPSPPPMVPMRAGWAQKTGKKYFLWTLHMVNPAARALLTDKHTDVDLSVLPPCAIEIVLDAPEKRDGGKGKKKRKGATEDLSRGGVDGGLRYVVVMPYPVEDVTEVGRDNHGLNLVVDVCEGEIPTPFVNVLQTIRADGAKLPGPLLSNWSFPVRRFAGGRRLKVCQANREFVDNLQLWLGQDGPFVDSSLLLPLHRLCRSLVKEFMRAGVEANGSGNDEDTVEKAKGPWHLVHLGRGGGGGGEGGGTAPPFEKGSRANAQVVLRVQDILVDESNESLLLDVTLGWWVDSSSNRGSTPSPLEAFCDDGESPLEVFRDKETPSEVFEDGNAPRSHKPTPVPLLGQLLPMAVERARRTYSHRQDCRYLGTNGAWGRRSGGGGSEKDEIDLVSLCSCGAGEDIPPALSKSLRDKGFPSVPSCLYRAVLPTLVAVDDVQGSRLKSPAIVESGDGKDGGGRGGGGGPGFGHLKDPVEISSGDMLSYNGPIRELGSIMESVPVAAVQERGGGVSVSENQPGSLSPAAASGFGVGGASSNANSTSNNNGQSSSAGASGAPGAAGAPGADAVAAADPLAGFDENTRAILKKAGFTKMPVTSADWAKFERVQKGLSAEPPCPWCNKPNATKKCTKCKAVKYCSRECQKSHWSAHKTECYADK